MASRCLLASLLSAALTGCSDGFVPAKGDIRVDGEAPQQGQLLLSPVGGGEQAFAYIEEPGRFELRTVSSSQGVKPGRYKAVFSFKPDAQMLTKIKQAGGSNFSPSEISITYASTDANLIEIPESGDKNMNLEIVRGPDWEFSFSE